MCLFCEKSPHLKEPVSRVLCTVDGILSSGDNVRLYEIKPTLRYEYASSWSGGQLHYTDNPVEGPHGEEIRRVIRFVLTEGEGFIGGFETWDDVRHFILWQMRAKIEEVS